MSNLIGQSLGRYHILEQLGEGGMATVYKAYDTRLECDVAVKVISTAKFTPEAVERALKRFEREAKALARLTHPNIVKVTDYGEYEGSPYLVMPFLPGGNLKQFLKERGRLHWQEATRLLLPIAQALEFAHSQNVIHRDVKPANILLTQNGQPMLTDFGVAKIIEEESTVELTGTAMMVGTPEYMAPEQVTSKSVDARTDIYALGIVFYEMVAGRKPYQADTPLAVLVKHASEPLPRPKQFVPDLPDQVEQVLFKALARLPQDRFQNMGDLAKALEKLAQGERARGRITSSDKTTRQSKSIPIRWVAGIIALLVVIISLLSWISFSNMNNTPKIALVPSITLVEETQTLQPSPSPTPFTSYRWDFDGSTQDWGRSNSNNIGTLTANNGLLTFMTVGFDPYLYSPSNLIISASFTPIITLRMRASAGTTAEIHFITNWDDKWDQKKNFPFLIESDNELHEYTLNMANLATWKYSVTQLRLDPTNTQAEVAVDYIWVHAP